MQGVRLAASLSSAAIAAMAIGVIGMAVNIPQMAVDALAQVRKCRCYGDSRDQQAPDF